MSEAMCAGCGRWPVFYETTQSCSTCQPGRASEMIDDLRARAEAAERERDEARRQAAALAEGLRLVSDALARLNQIYRSDIDLGDPPVETPAWLQEAQHRAAALLAPTTPTPAPTLTDAARAALAGEGEACASAKERLPGECCRCYQTSDLPSCSDGREHCQHHSGGEAAEAQPTCTRCRMEPAYETLRICLGCSHVPGVVAPVDDDTLTATHLAAVQEERERCARIAETYPLAPDTHTGTRQRAMREGIAEAIRGGEEAPCHYCDYEDQEPCFSAFFGYFYCTRPKGHDGVHVACSESKHAVAMVSVDTIPEKAGEA